MRHALPGSQPASSRAGSAGFTLVELMMVVAITGILAAVGVVLVRGHVQAAKSTQAIAGIQAIRVAEEAARAEGGQYLSCSDDSAQWYPVQTPGKVKYEWRQPDHPDWARWRVLGVPRTGPTQYGYLVYAGPAGSALPAVHTAQRPDLPAVAPNAWYVIEVKGNVDGDKTYMQGVAWSDSSEMYFERESE